MLYDLDPEEILEFAKRWRDLGDAVIEQVERVVQDPTAEASDENGINPAAITFARRRLGGLNEAIDEAFTDFFAELAAHERMPEPDGPEDERGSPT